MKIVLALCLLTISHGLRNNTDDFKSERPCDLSDSHQYKCPLIIEPPVNKTIHEFEELIMSCDVLGDPVPNIRWKHNGNYITDGSKYELSSNGKILRIDKASLDDSGKYDCWAENSYGTVSAFAYIRIEKFEDPTFRLIPVSQKIKQGKNLVLNCVLQGRPQPKIHWEHRKKSKVVRRFDIPSGKFGHFHYNQFYDNGRIIVEASRLVILSADEEDSGYYRCVAQSLHFNKVVAAEAQVEIELDPEIENTQAILSLKNIMEAERGKIRERINKKKRNRQYQVRTLFSPREMMRRVFYPSEQSMESDAHRLAFENTISNINNEKLQTLTPGLHSAPVFSKEELMHILNSTKCMEVKTPTCNPSSPYPNHDGTCNNLEHPLWGSTGQQFLRLLTPDYEDGFSQPIGFNSHATYYGFKKPSPRTISVQLLGKHTQLLSNYRSDLFTHFSQMAVHDTNFKADSSVEVGSKSGIPCDKSCENDLPCFPIQVTMNVSYSLFPNKEKCFTFTRAAAKCQAVPDYIDNVKRMTPPVREQLNAVTSYLDVSTLYGSNDEMNAKVFDLLSDPTGQHKVGLKGENGLTYLPLKNDSKSCSSANKKPFPCFQAGDVRVNDHTMLMTIHTLLMRFHNQIAEHLAEINPQWLLQKEKVYQETRKIVRGIIQHIVYEELLPITLGPVGMRILGDYQGYDKTINPGVSSEASSAAGKVGHYQGNSFIYRLNEDKKSIGHMMVSQSMFNSYSFFFEGGDSPLIRGAFTSRGKEINAKQPINIDFIDRAFTSINKRNDLASIDIQRSREFGHQSYNSFRRACGLQWAETFDDFKEEIVYEDVRKIMKELYGHPGNVDLYVGLGLERKIDGGSMGPTARCIMADSYKRSRDGDRFFYKNSQFNKQQLKVIEEFTFAKLICIANQNIKSIQSKVFLQPSLSKQLKCSDIKRMDLSGWKESRN